MSVVFLAIIIRKKGVTFDHRKRSVNSFCEACGLRGGLGESGRSSGHTSQGACVSNRHAR